jgi:hypothetical protein
MKSFPPGIGCINLIGYDEVAERELDLPGQNGPGAESLPGRTGSDNWDRMLLKTLPEGYHRPEGTTWGTSEATPYQHVPLAMYL